MKQRDQAQFGRRAAITRPLPPAVIPADTSLLDAPVTPAPQQPITWERAIEQWARHLRSVKTRATYLSQVRAFLREADGAAPTPDALTYETLDAYAGALAYRAERESDPQRRLAPATVNLKIAALRSFLQFARKRRWLAADLTGELIGDTLVGIKAHIQRPYQIVEGDEQTRLLDAAGQAKNAARALAFMALGLGSGLRLAELCALDVGDLATDATSCYVDVRQGKGHKDRQVPVSDDVYALVLAYLAETGRAVWATADRATPLFLSRNRHNAHGGRLSERQAQSIVEDCARRAGLLDRGKHITPHALRHSYGIDLIKGDAESGRPGAPLPAVAKMMGHSSIAVTGRYLNHFERGELSAYAPRLRRSAAQKREEGE